MSNEIDKKLRNCLLHHIQYDGFAKVAELMGMKFGDLSMLAAGLPISERKVDAALERMGIMMWGPVNDEPSDVTACRRVINTRVAIDDDDR